MLKTDEIEDIVQTMYLLLHKNTQKGINFMYNDTEINYWYVYKILKGLHIDLVRKKSKVKMIRFDNYVNDVNEEKLYGYQFYSGNSNYYKRFARKIEDLGYDDQEPDYVTKYEEIQKALKKMHWYDAKVYEIIESGVKISVLARKTNISYYSLYNTYNKAKEKLKKYI